jgi:hypothetical protein
MKVLVACEFSGSVRDAFARRGHDAWSCDLLPSETPGNHIQGDALQVLGDGWDLLIAHPPCTYLSYAANHAWNRPGRAELREEAMKFFMKMINAPVPRICVENPVGYPNTVYRKPDQTIHPYMFGDKQLKRTCLWLKNLPHLWYWEHENSLFQRTATDYPEPVYATLREDGSTKLRHFTEASHGGHVRSVTFPSIARAMAEQWSNL